MLFFDTASHKITVAGAKWSSAMFARMLAPGFFLFVALTNIASAQILCGNVIDLNAAGEPLFQPLSSPMVVSPTSSMPDLKRLARQPFDRVQPRPNSCESHTQQEPYWAHRRSASAARTQTASTATPAKNWTYEELAGAKFRVAHLLWQGGNAPAARKWLDEIITKYGETETAARARITLAKL
jgi:hypothetical protein